MGYGWRYFNGLLITNKTWAYIGISWEAANNLARVCTNGLLSDKILMICLPMAIIMRKSKDALLNFCCAEVYQNCDFVHMGCIRLTNLGGVELVGFISS